MSYKKIIGLGILAVATHGTHAALAYYSLLTDIVSKISDFHQKITPTHFDQSYPAGTAFSTTDASPRYNSPVPNLIAFCRFGAEYNTSANSKFRFEVWMPSPEEWNVVAPPRLSDGVVAGAPAQRWTHLSVFLVHVNLLNAKNTTPGAIIPTPFFSALFDDVTSQCDEVDGVKDGIITNPRRCKSDLGNLACVASSPSAFVNSSTCLSEQQMSTLETIRSNWTSSSGEFLYPTVEPGSEFEWNGSVTGIAYQVGRPQQNQHKACGSCRFSSSNLRATVYYSTLSVNETELQAILEIADETNPGDIEAMDPDLRPFFNRGGKLMQFHGFEDPLIPSGSSLVFYEKVQSFFNHTDLADKYNLFMVPGTAHYSDGRGANAFGTSNQRDVSLGGAGQALKFDAEHDMILATIDWVEKGRVPKSIVATRWKDSNITNGADYTRLLCPYPQEGIYKGGDDTKASSYVCGMPA
ncbi:tannase and feruloyl esterase-domain-containing protein [Rhizoctonia solani]|nr:tannase and feruloyl esterase-domain-containing protein [Rhizoctonia solani]